MNVDELKELQSRIIKKNKTCNLISIISLIVLLFVTLFIFLEKELDLKFILFGLLFELIFGLGFCTIIKVIVNGKSISKFRKEYKNIFVLNALTNNFENLTYDFEDGFSEQKIRETGMACEGAHGRGTAFLRKAGFGLSELNRMGYNSGNRNEK